MPQFNEMEEAALWESPEAIQVLIHYHEEQVLIGESRDYPMGWNKNRVRELKERRIKLLTDPKPEEEGQQPVFNSHYD